MERTKLGLSKDKMYKALGEGERTSKKVSSIRMSDGSTFKRKNANQYGTAEGGNDYTEKRSNRTDRFDLGGTADSSNSGANMGGTMGSSVMKNGGYTTKLKEIALPNSNLYLYGWGRDTNGNSTIKIGFPNRKGFTIQTNGVLPFSNSIKNTSLSDLSENDIEKIEKEVVNYVTNYGSSNQKSIMKAYKTGGNLVGISGKMKTGGHVSKGELVWKKLSSSDKINFLYKNFTPQITPKSQEILVGKAFNFLPKNVKIKMESEYANVEEYANGGGLADLPENPNNDAISYKTGGVMDNRMNERTRAVILKIQKTGIHPDDVSPNFVNEIAYDNGIKLKSEEVVFISDNYNKKRSNGGGLANTPESFPSNDAVSYKTGGRIKKITEWSISTNNEDEHFDNYKDAKDFWNNLDKKEKETGQFFKKSYINGEEDDVEILDGKLSGYANGGTTKGFEYTIGGL